MCILFLIKKYKHKKEEPEEIKAEANTISFRRGLTFATPAGRNLIFVLILGVASTLDYTVTNLSIQPYYEILAGDSSQAENLYGLANGIYWIAQLVLAPIFGIVVDKTQSYKSVFLLGLFLQAMGNALYGLLFVIELRNQDLGWKMMIVSRVLQGMGSAVIITATAYITTFTSLQDRASVLGTYRFSQIFTKFVGSFLAFMFIPMPEPTATSSTALMVFNFYTMGAWTAVLLCIGTAILGLVLFEEPEHQETVESQSLSEFVKTCESDTNKTSIYVFLLSSSFIQLLVGFSLYSIISQTFGFAVAQYHSISDQVSIWKPWLAFGIGSMAASWIWKLANQHLPGNFPERIWTNAGIVAGFFGVLFLFPFTETPSVVFMYIAFPLIAFSLCWFGVNQEIVFSKQVTFMTRFTKHNRDGAFMAIYMMVNALANFLGPFLGGNVMIIQPLEYAECNITASTYVAQGCYLSNVSMWITLLLAMLAVAFICNIFFDSKVVNYPKEDDFVSDDECNQSREEVV